ncbi:MAG: glycosyl transferase family 1 [Devosia nanyangense]|uniref:Glycosyl transferase family 1 n=1 Tax=Devosia nanyangense TaxID=1228055 RepID=A0A933L7I1_9HYPH|nr:glycosyl transferase family 1 [Devosia nanyangense]
MRNLRALLSSGKTDPVPRINFVNWELFHRILAPNRMAIIQAMTGAGPLSIREVARRVGRDFKGVHTDVTALLSNGLLEKTEDDLVIFPYDEIHFDFVMRAADQSAA